YPANIHTDLAPIVRGKDKVVWLRPQMYESVPYERWRFHTYVELMRGCRGWQIAHGPGDASLFRGLHGELEFFKPIVASKDAGPAIHGIQYFPDARIWPKGTKVVQWVKLGVGQAASLPESPSKLAARSTKCLVILAKADGRWTHAASWGKPDLAALRKDPDT